MDGLLQKILSAGSHSTICLHRGSASKNGAARNNVADWDELLSAWHRAAIGSPDDQRGAGLLPHTGWSLLRRPNPSSVLLWSMWG